MSVGENKILNRWLARHEIEGHLHREFVLGPEKDSMNCTGYQKLVQRVFARRCDAVILQGKETALLIEVKLMLDETQLGQLLTRKVLLQKWFTNLKNIRLIALAEKTDADLEPIFKSYGIEIFIV